MNGVNKVIILGNLGKDPEVKELQSGSKVANFPVATTESYKDKDGQKQERTEWHQVEIWNRQAEIAQQYLNKGSTVFIEGKIKTDKWKDNDGNDRYKTKVRGLSMTMLGGKGSNQGGNDGSQQQQQQQQGSQEGEWQAPDQNDDDLPF